MKINSKENISLWEKLFQNEENYNKWAPYFKEFIQEAAGRCHCIGAALTMSELTVNEDALEVFYEWLQEKGVEI